MKALTVKKVSKGFQDRKQILPRWMVSNSRPTKFYAVKNVSLEVKKREIFGILGPNGCGKSTLIRMMSTLLIPDTGDIELLGFNVVEKPNDVKKIINRVSVEASFFKSLSARENLLYVSRLYGLDDKDATEKFVSILDELGFPEDQIDEPMKKFSRGMQQKVSIARGFITDPKVILLDEPTTGLDPKSKLDVQRFIERIHKEKDLTIIVSSHDMNEVDKLCDRILIMDKGKMIAQGTSDELKRLIMKEDIYELDTSNTEKAERILKKLKGVMKIKRKNGTIQFCTKDISTTADRITRQLRKNHIKFEHLKKVVPTLEDVFLELTGKSLEDKE